MLAICPHCGKTIQVEDPGWTVCRICGRKGWIPDPMNPDSEIPPPEPPPASLPPPSAGSGAPEGEAPGVGDAESIPWENPLSGVAPKRFFRTFFLVLFSPSLFFRTLPDFPPRKRARYFAYIVLTLGLLGYFTTMWLSMKYFEWSLASGALEPPWDEFGRNLLKELETLRIDDGFFLASSVLSPLFAFAICWFSTNLLAVTCALGSGVRPSTAVAAKILRIAAYVYAPWVFLAFTPVAGLWQFLLFAFAVRRALGVSWLRALAASLMNLFFLSFFYGLWIRFHFWLAS